MWRWRESFRVSHYHLLTNHRAKKDNMDCMTVIINLLFRMIRVEKYSLCLPFRLSNREVCIVNLILLPCLEICGVDGVDDGDGGGDGSGLGPITF